jgi:hypothetical protein
LNLKKLGYGRNSVGIKINTPIFETVFVIIME